MTLLNNKIGDSSIDLLESSNWLSVRLCKKKFYLDEYAITNFGWLYLSKLSFKTAVFKTHHE